MKYFNFFISFFLLYQLFQISKCNKIDDNGYIVFCPCMGRFGNQMDQFLGAMQFAKNLDRTLVLPHWVEYPSYTQKSIQVPFDTYFKVEPLREYLKVILMEDFMKDVALTIWPVGKRTVFCYASRGDKKCNAKEGNPFGPYWDKFDINFDNDLFHAPLLFESVDTENWLKKYPSNKYPVLAFTGVPGEFPARPHNALLQKYLHWSDLIENESDRVLKQLKKNESNDENDFIAIHMRNGLDFKAACEHIESNRNFFASHQCLGMNLEYGKLTKEICYPSEETIIEQVNFFKNNNDMPHVDLCILGRAKYVIINCVSSFSAFVKRERDVIGKPTEFWSFESQVNNEEL